MVLEKSSLKIVGTYRVRTIEMAGNTKGFYSAGEFDLTCLPPGILAESVELGRACIAREHRNRQVLFLLWKALIVYLTSNRKRFFFGCCSLTSQDPRDGIEVLNYLARNGYMHPTLKVPPQPSYECVVNGFCAFARTEVKIPRLFDTYLGIGAKVCGGPAIDRLFKTIDFLVIFDIQQMDEKTHRLLFTV